MITLKQAAAWCGGRVLPEYENIEFFGACNDSRKIQPGQLFAALIAERDGHDFIPGALENGAAAVLGQRQLPGVPMIVVPDSGRGLMEIAAGWRRELDGTRVIGLTGSVGKTTAKEMSAAACGSVYSTVKTQGNLNNEIGVPLTVLSIPRGADCAVVEMGMNHAGELSRLTRIARPHVAIITMIGKMHIENFNNDQAGICRAKLEILDGLEPGGAAVLNGDDPLLRAAAPAVKTLWFGLGPDNDLRAEEIRTDLDGISFMAVGLGQRIPVRLPVPGEHNVMNALAALLAAHCVGVPLEPAAAALADFKNTGNRMRIFEAKGFTLLADCYNAGPESTPAALKVLRDRPARGRRIAVLGDMLELGAHAPESHRMVGELAAQCADRVLAYGPLSVDIAAGAGAKGEHFLEKEQLLAALRALARPGDAILFKASHSMHLEQVLDQFTE